MRRKLLLCWKAYLPRSSWPTQPTTQITCAKPSLPKARLPSSPTTHHGHSNIRSTSISIPSAISWSAASQNSSNSAASRPASKRPPEITGRSSLSQPSFYGCDKCPHRLDHRRKASKRQRAVPRRTHAADCVSTCLLAASQNRHALQDEGSVGPHMGRLDDRPPLRDLRLLPGSQGFGGEFVL